MIRNERYTIYIMKRIAFLPLTLALALVLSGCGAGKGIYANYRAIEELQTVQTLGLDQDDRGRTVALAGMRTSGEEASAILRRSGDSILLAIRALEDYTDRGQLFFAHARYVLLGRAQAEAGFGPLLDYTERDPLTRMGASVFVLKNSSVETLLAEIGDGNKLASTLESIRRNTELWGGSQVTDLRSTAVALSEYGAALVCALSVEPTEGSVLSDGPATIPVPDGYAILKGGALVDFLQGGQAETVGLLQGRPAVVTRRLPVDGGGSVTVSLRSGGADIQPVWETGKLVLEIRLPLLAVIAEADDVRVPITQGPVPEDLAAEISDQVTEELEQVLALSKTLDADFLALARQLRLKGVSPTTDWLQNVEFRVSVETVIDNSNDLHESLSTGGSEQ